LQEDRVGRGRRLSSQHKKDQQYGVQNRRDRGDAVYAEPFMTSEDRDSEDGEE